MVNKYINLYLDNNYLSVVMDYLNNNIFDSSDIIIQDVNWCYDLTYLT